MAHECTTTKTHRTCGIHAAGRPWVQHAWEEILIASYTKEEGQAWIERAESTMLPPRTAKVLDDEDTERVDLAYRSSHYYRAAVARYMAMVYQVPLPEWIMEDEVAA